MSTTSTVSTLSAHRAGKTSTRSSGKVQVQFGPLITVPLKLYSAVDDEARVKRSQFTTDGHPVGNLSYDKTTKKPYTGDVVKKAAVADGEDTVLVELTDDEIESVLGDGVRDVGEVECFIPLSALGREYLVIDTKQARVDPDDVNAAKTYTVLRTAMAQVGVAALLKVTMRTVTRYAALTPDGYLLVLAYADQVRQFLPLGDAEFSDKELTLAGLVISDLVGVADDVPVLVDTDGARLREYLAKKAKDGTVATPAAEAAAPAAAQDLTALLELAVAAAKAGKAGTVADAETLEVVA